MVVSAPMQELTPVPHAALPFKGQRLIPAKGIVKMHG